MLPSVPFDSHHMTMARSKGEVMAPAPDVISPATPPQSPPREDAVLSPAVLRARAFRLAPSAAKVLQGNTRVTTTGSSYTVPSPHLYPHQWAWDSAFIALGFAAGDEARRGLSEIEALLSGQWEDGRIPHIMYHYPSDQYWPTPEYYGTETRVVPSSTITQPPIWGIALAALHRADPGMQSVEEWQGLVGKVVASHEWYYSARDPLHFDCIAVAHPWESGLDNGPMWDSALANVDPAHAVPFTRRDKDKVKDAAMERPTDAQYARYASIVTQIKANGFGMSGEFAVYDPVMTAILARAEIELAELADSVGMPGAAEECRARSARLAAGLEKNLYDGEGRFRYYDAIAREAVSADVVGNYLPLIAPGISKDVREATSARMAEVYLAEDGDVGGQVLPLPSAPRNAPYFEANKYWRGPVWLNMLWAKKLSARFSLGFWPISSMKSAFSPQVPFHWDFGRFLR
mmetsp:Transcript_47736/g.153042  ORF Transcript_47736/g.153042 Transcript_47736/m.153042 type:complete len:460 (+) Transcript_47736:178-1557(+)